MSRGSGRPTDANGDAFPFWDEPERRRRRGKKPNESYRKSGDGVRSRRPHPEDDEDWENDYDESDWRLTGLDDLDDDELAGAAEWEDDTDLTDLDDDEADDFDGEEDWQSRDDR